MESNKELVDDLKSCSQELQTTSPSKAFDDLEELNEVLENRKVIGMGEAPHGTSEFFQMKDRMFRFLVEELDYRVFGLEAGFGKAIGINDYIDGESSLEEAVEGLHYGVWQTDEAAELLKWCRDYNQEASEDDKIRFYGYDMQNDISSTSRLLDITETENLGDGILDALDFIEDVNLHKTDLGREKLESVEDNLEKLKDQLTGFEDEELYLRYVRVLEQGVEWAKLRNDIDIEEPETTPYHLREKYVTENISWINSYEDDPVFIWAHNGHIRNGFREIDGHTDQSMGGHLKEKYGDEYYKIGFEFGKGSLRLDDHLAENDTAEFKEIKEGTAAEILNDVGEKYFLNLNCLSRPSRSSLMSREIHSAGSYLHLGDVQNHYELYDSKNEFDALIFIGETEAAKEFEGQA